LLDLRSKILTATYGNKLPHWQDQAHGKTRTQGRTKEMTNNLSRSASLPAATQLLTRKALS